MLFIKIKMLTKNITFVLLLHLSLLRSDADTLPIVQLHVLDNFNSANN